MNIFRCNPIKPQHASVTRNPDLSNLPIIFVPRIYVRQKKRSLYINLYVLLGGLWALTVSHDIDLFETEARVMLKNILSRSGLFVSHLVAVPIIIRNLRLHYSIILGAIGMGATSFLYCVRNSIVLSVAICLRVIFVALFDVSAMVYIIKLSRLCSKIQGNPAFNEILVARSFTTIFGCAANIVSLAWRHHIQESQTTQEEKSCSLNICFRTLQKKTRLISLLSIGENTMFTAISVVITLSGVILITMYLKPIKGFGDFDLLDEPQASNPGDVLKQITRPRAKKLVILIIHCVFVHAFTNEFILQYVACSVLHEHSMNNVFISSMKEVTIVFGALSCITLVDLVSFYWLYGIALFTQFSSYLCLSLTDLNMIKSPLFYLMVYYVLFISISFEMSILQLFLIETLGDQEVSTWCFYSVLEDVVYLVKIILDSYVCIGLNLWIFVGVSPVAMIAIYSYASDENSSMVSLFGAHSMLIKTMKNNFAKSASFNLNIFVDEYKGIRKVETFLERSYTLKSKFLVPPPDDFGFEAYFSFDQDH